MERKTPAARFDPCRDPYTTALIRKKVTALTSKRPFSRADRDDLYQEILSAVAASAENIDDEIGHRNPYITAIVERQVSSIRKRQQASKRNNAGVSSLNVAAESDDGRTTDLIATLSLCDGDRRVCRDRRLSEEEVSSLRIDLAEVISELPKAWQQMLELCSHHSLSEVSRQMNVPRTTLCSWMSQIRAKLVEREIHKYFQN